MLGKTHTHNVHSNNNNNVPSQLQSQLAHDDAKLGYMYTNIGFLLEVEVGGNNYNGGGGCSREGQIKCVCTPVSYTHLDVYKRQRPHIVVGFPRV